MLPKNEDLRKRHAPLKDFRSRNVSHAFAVYAGDAGEVSEHGYFARLRDYRTDNEAPFTGFSARARICPVGNAVDIAGSGRPADCGYDALPGSGQYGLELEQSLLAESGRRHGAEPIRMWAT